MTELFREGRYNMVPLDPRYREINVGETPQIAIPCCGCAIESYLRHRLRAGIFDIPIERRWYEANCNSDHYALPHLSDLAIHYGMSFGIYPDRDGLIRFFTRLNAQDEEEAT